MRSGPGGNLLQARENSNFHKMRLLRGVYPEELERLAMTSRGGLIYAKSLWDKTLDCVGRSIPTLQR